MKPSSLIPVILSAFFLVPVVPAIAVDDPIDGKLEWVIGMPWGDGNIDGVGEAARFAGPLFLAPDPRGGLLISDNYADTIRRADANLRVTTVAGQSGVGAFRDGLARDARFSWPEGLVAAPDGSIFVADQGNDVIRKISPDGQVSLFAGKPGESGSTDGRGVRARFNHPEAIVLDAEGRLWVAEGYGASLRVISPSGYVRTWRPDPSDEQLGDRYGLAGVKFMAMAPDGSLVIANEVGVARFKDGRLTRLLDDRSAEPQEEEDASAEAPSKLKIKSINGLAVRADGAIFVSDKDQGVVFQLLDGGALKIVAGRISDERSNGGDGPADTALLHEPGSLAFDNQGRFFVTNVDASVQEILPNGEVRNVLGMARWYQKHGVDPKNLPRGSLDVAVQTEKGDYFVVQRLDSEIHQYDANGQHLRQFGMKHESLRPPRSETMVDGESGQSRFGYPQDIVVGRDGELFVAEESGIRRIAPDGTVSSLLAGGGTSDRMDGGYQEARFFRPHRLAFDGKHHLYVLDNSPFIGGGPVGEVVRRIDLDAQQVSTVLDMEGVFEIHEKLSAEVPYRDIHLSDIAVGPDERLYVLGESGDLYTWRADEGVKLLLPPDRLGSNVPEEVIFNAEGKKVENNLVHYQSLSGRTEHLAVDARGNVYMTDALAKVVLRRDPAGNIDIIVGSPGLVGNVAGPLPGALENPEGLSITPSGDLLITVLYGGVIRIKDPHRVRGQRVVLSESRQ